MKNEHRRLLDEEGVVLLLDGDGAGGAVADVDLGVAGEGEDVLADGVEDDADSVRLMNETVLHVDTWRELPLKKLEIRSNEGVVLMQLLSSVTLLLRGDIVENASAQQLTLDGNEEEFVVRDEFGNVPARLDSSTGDLYLDGFYLARDSNIQNRSGSCFQIRDGGENVLLTIDNNGRMHTKGLVYKQFSSFWL